MKTIFYLNGKKTTCRAIKDKIGAERLARMLKEAKEASFDDPGEQNDFFIGDGILTIEFR